MAKDPLKEQQKLNAEKQKGIQLENKYNALRANITKSYGKETQLAKQLQKTAWSMQKSF